MKASRPRVAHRFCVEADIAAPATRVWRALCEPTEVEAWAGVARKAVPEGYPAPGQHARWRAPLGPLALTLHDRVRAVEAERRLAATLEVGPARVEEEYRLVPTDAGTWLVADYDVSGRWAGLGWLAPLSVERDLRTSIRQLKAYCER